MHVGTRIYGESVYMVYKLNLKKNMGRTNLSDLFRKVMIHFVRIGFNLNVMRQSACYVSDPTTVSSLLTF